MLPLGRGLRRAWWFQGGVARRRSGHGCHCATWRRDCLGAHPSGTPRAGGRSPAPGPPAASAHPTVLLGADQAGHPVPAGRPPRRPGPRCVARAGKAPAGPWANCGPVGGGNPGFVGAGCGAGCAAGQSQCCPAHSGGDRGHSSGTPLRRPAWRAASPRPSAPQHGFLRCWGSPGQPKAATVCFFRSLKVPPTQGTRHRPPPDRDAARRSPALHRGVGGRSC